jgi:hypothetical protein
MHLTELTSVYLLKFAIKKRKVVTGAILLLSD